MPTPIRRHLYVDIIPCMFLNQKVVKFLQHSWNGIIAFYITVPRPIRLYLQWNIFQNVICTWFVALQPFYLLWDRHVATLKKEETTTTTLMPTNTNIGVSWIFTSAPYVLWVMCYDHKITNLLKQSQKGSVKWWFHGSWMCRRAIPQYFSCVKQVKAVIRSVSPVISSDSFYWRISTNDSNVKDVTWCGNPYITSSSLRIYIHDTMPWHMLNCRGLITKAKGH